MAKLNSLEIAGFGSSGAGDGIFAMLASFGLLICMVSTLMGIKIWWFKHRLTFNHSSTNNGAAGGATPTVPLRTRSSREKRTSQQISEPVEVHGVFRRREEDDLNIVPTRQLPPVRIRKLSQSTPSLFPLPPPRRQDKVRSGIFKEYEPPTREPPRPPVDSLQTLADSPQPRTPTISLVEEMPTFDELEQKFRQMELKEEKPNEVGAELTESILRKRESPPQPPKRLNRNSYREEKLVGMNKFIKAKSPSTEAASYQPKMYERRATSYLRPDEENIEATVLPGAQNSPLHEVEAMHFTSVEEFGERRPTGYIKYEEIDVDGLEDFREKWEKLQASLGTASPTPYPHQHSERVDYEAFHGHKYDHINRASAHESLAIVDGAPATYANDSHKLEREERFGWETDDRAAGKYDTPVSLESIDFTSDEEYADELGGVKRNTILKSASVPNCSVGNYEAANYVEPQRLDEDSSPAYAVTFENPQREEEVASYDAVNEEDAFNTRQSTDSMHATRSEQLWDELEANISQDEREKRVWLEIEQELDLNRDFVSNIEEEFDKIRHSYEENEAAFLESTGSLKRVPEQVLIASPEPEGFGKSIDEDWESFENLAVEKPKMAVEADKHVVQFNFADLEDAYDSDRDSVLRTERRPTGFMRHSAQFKRELSNIEDEDEPTSPHYNVSRVEFVEQNHARFAPPPKEDRPIGYAHAEISDLDEDYMREHSKDSIFEPVAEPLTQTTKARARPRPRQKVTFDFSSTEYYHASNDDEDEDENEDQNEQQAVTRFLSTTKSSSYDSDSVEEEAAHQTVPKPTQRTSKPYYVDEMNDAHSGTSENQIRLTPSPTSSPAPASLLYDTPISLKTAETDLSESWTAISQLQMKPTASGRTISSRPMSPALLNISEQPKPAYRNQVAQASMVKSVVFMEESIITQHQQQPMSSFKPQVAMRQHYFERSYHNSTEA